MSGAPGLDGECSSQGSNLGLTLCRQAGLSREPDVCVVPSVLESVPRAWVVPARRSGPVGMRTLSTASPGLATGLLSPQAEQAS